MLENKTIQELVRKQEQDYISGTPVHISKYVDFDMHENLSKIDAYLNSKHISGDQDSQGRDKPFFNIVTAAVNIWYRATDIDRKNIRIKADTETNIFPAFVATQKLNAWMKKARFGVFLNKWGRTLAINGSAVTKFVEQDGELVATVVPWNRLIVDPVAFEKAPVIEKLYMTKSELKNRKGYDKVMVENLLGAISIRETLDKQDKDQKDDYIELYEVHGMLPLSYLTGKEEDEEEFVQQMHIVSFIESKEKGDYDDFTIYAGREKNPYMLTHLIEEEGRTQAIGAIEHLFEAQWMQNHTVKSIKDQLDLASKLIFQTSDGNFAGQNALYAIETGDIIVHKPNEPITQLANSSHDITALQNFGQQWNTLAKEITSTPDAISGGTMPSGTAYRQVAILNQESHSLFELMTENKGLAIEDMMRGHIIPFLKTKLDTTDEIVAVLDTQNISQVDSKHVKYKALKSLKNKIKESLLKGEVPAGLTLEEEMMGVEAQSGDTRFFIPSEEPDVTWKDVFEDLEWEVDVEVTSENTDKEATLTTLSTVLQQITSNPAILQDPNGKMLFNAILEETGRISPIQLSQAQSTPQALGQPEAQAPQFTP